MSNAAETFELDYSNLLEALGELDDAWRDWRSPVGGWYFVDILEVAFNSI